MTNSRRVAYVLMSYHVILGAAAASPDPVESNLPADARVSHIVLLPETQQAQVYFDSESLDLVPETALIPMFDVRLRTTFLVGATS